jgi:hypothetical protein
VNQKLTNIEPLVMDGVEIAILDQAIHFSGVISMRSPSETVTPFLRKVHDAVIDSGVKALTVDITKLRFMNSSSIRSLVDWVEWIRGEPEFKRYVLHFVTKPDVLWQTTTLNAIQSFGGKHVVVHPWAS